MDNSVPPPRRDNAVYETYRLAEARALRAFQRPGLYPEEHTRKLLREYDVARAAYVAEYKRYYRALLEWSDATREVNRRLCQPPTRS